MTICLGHGSHRRVSEKHRCDIRAYTLSTIARGYLLEKQSGPQEDGEVDCRDVAKVGIVRALQAFAGHKINTLRR